MARSTANHKYSLRAYSRDLNISPGFLSEVIRGSKALSPITSKKIFSKLGFTAEEVAYLQNLLTYSNSTDELLRRNAFNEIQRHYNGTHFIDSPDKKGFIKSVEHFIIYGVLRKVANYAELLKITDQLALKPDRIAEIISDLVADGLVEKKESKYEVTDLKITLKQDFEILNMIKELSNFLIQIIQKEGGISIPNRVAHGLILGFDTKTFELAIEAQKHFIRQLHRLSESTSRPEQFVLLSNVWMALGNVSATK